MRKIEEILDKENWENYQEIISNRYFIPFIGAGLSIPLGMFNWEDLMKKIMEYCMNKDFNRCDANWHMDLDNIDNENKKIINQAFDMINNQAVESDLSEEIINAKIKNIKNFVAQTKNDRFAALIQYKVFKKILTNKNDSYALYEAGQLIEEMYGKQNIKNALEQIIKEVKGNKWDIGPEKAVYWLPYICQENEGKKLVYTTNYDDIIKASFDTYEKEYSFPANDDIRYLHKNPEPIITLNDLLVEYNRILNNNERLQMTNVERNIIRDNRYLLFIGTSFTEDHLAQLIIRYFVNNRALRHSREIYNMAATGFCVPNDKIIFYGTPTEDKDHEELVSILHQMARDVSMHYIWNQMAIIYIYTYGADEKLLNSKLLDDYNKLDEVTETYWLKKGDSNFPIVKYESKDKVFYVQCNNILFVFLKQLIDEFYNKKRPIMVFPLIENDITWMDNDIAPLGDTLYIFLESEDQERGNELEEKINGIISQDRYKNWFCNIFRVVLEKDVINCYMEWKRRVDNRYSDRRIFIGFLYNDKKEIICALTKILYEIIEQFNQKDKELRINKVDKRQEIASMLEDIKNYLNEMMTEKGKDK